MLLAPRCCPSVSGSTRRPGALNDSSVSLCAFGAHRAPVCGAGGNACLRRDVKLGCRARWPFLAGPLFCSIRTLRMVLARLAIVLSLKMPSAGNVTPSTCLHNEFSRRLCIRGLCNQSGPEGMQDNIKLIQAVQEKPLVLVPGTVQSCMVDGVEQNVLQPHCLEHTSTLSRSMQQRTSTSQMYKPSMFWCSCFWQASMQPQANGRRHQQIAVYLKMALMMTAWSMLPPTPEKSSWMLMGLFRPITACQISCTSISRLLRGAVYGTCRRRVQSGCGSAPLNTCMPLT